MLFRLISRIGAIVAQFERIGGVLDALETAAGQFLAICGEESASVADTQGAGVAASIAAPVAPCPVDRLKALFSDPRFKFRKLSTLAAGIGHSVAETVGLLETIGATHARGNDTLWRLPASASVASVATSQAAAAPVADGDKYPKLRELLADPRFKFRKLSTLAAGIGETESVTVIMLRAISARPARGNETLWRAGSSASVATSQVASSDPAAKLRGMLRDSAYRFRKLTTLAAAVSLGKDETSELLRDIGARPARNNGELWILETDESDDYDSDDDESNEWDDESNERDDEDDC